MYWVLVLITLCLGISFCFTSVICWTGTSTFMDAPLGGPLPVNFSNTYVPNLEINKVKSTESLIYKCFVDDAIYRRKKNTPDSLLTFLKNYHLNITSVLRSIFPKWNMIKLKRLLTESHVRCLYIGRPKFPNVTKGMQ